MNRAAKRARERAQSRSALTSNHFAKGEVADESFPPEPGPIGTELGRYRFGGKVWTLITVHQPNVSTKIVFAPGDARKFAHDILALCDGLSVSDDPPAEMSAGPGGLVIAHDLPKEP